LLFEVSVANRNQVSDLAKDLMKNALNVDKYRTIDLHFWARGKESAQKMLQCLTEAGFRSVLAEPSNFEDDPDRWNVQAQVSTSIRKIVDQSFAAEMSHLAFRCGATYDGWGLAM
jgi:regulator of RNase E activity RraB